MFDLYRLPMDFPGYAGAAEVPDPYTRVAMLEDALKEAIPDQRLVPYIQLHEFEALLFADPQTLEAQFPDRPSAIQQLVATPGAVDSPELIDDGQNTAPSKRIIGVIPEYESRKASAGPIVAAKIGLPVLQARCPHFREWLERLAPAA